jgi:O-acetyl-ADP-ribose deacetylase (regulator of RNase III)/uncharacterized protein YwgA
MKYVKGNILESNAEALVNTINTVGVMGKGIALQFKEHFPLNYELYAIACKKGEVQTGKMFVTATNSMMNPKWIINFPTKKHWMHKSSYGYIEAGLEDLLVQIRNLNIRSIAIPPLGAGQGGLNWEKVKRLIEDKIKSAEVEVTIYEPIADWRTTQNQNKTHLTKARALILSLINQYRILGFDISLLEIQKLAYFLQRMGQIDLKLNYKEYLYGPYANNLQHLLHELEKGYIQSKKPIHDSKPLDIIYFNTESTPDIARFVERVCSVDEKKRLSNIVKLMSGFESPFGLELLATVDWIMIKEGNKDITAEDIKVKIKKWSKRKDDIFTFSHINSTLNRLKDFEQELSYS